VISLGELSAMASLPSSSSRWIQFKHGYALGICNLWDKGQYCSIITPAGIVGCGIYDLKTPAEFDQAIAIAKGTPANPLKEPEDLFEAKIVGMTPKAASFGIALGMTGREAVELMQIASLKIEALPIIENPTSLLQVKAFDHITLVVKDLKASQNFYVNILGMRLVPRPPFSFDGLWFQLGRVQMHLILEYEGSSPAGNLLPEEKRQTRGPHFAFEVADADAVIGILKQNNIPILSGPKLRPDGYVQVFISDPDGHMVELCSVAK